MKQKFIENNYEIVNFNTKADIYIINTCTVTSMSDKKSRNILRKAKHLNKNSIIVAVGCYAQVEADKLQKIPEIDLVLGNTEKINIIQHIQDFISNNANSAKVSDIINEREYSEFGSTIYTEKTRAIIKIQDGCDRYCSYCIIPYARGRVRSRKLENIKNEVIQISKHSIKEIVLTGIHIASYGKDFNNKITLIDLLEELDKINGIQRIRLGSLEPIIFTEEFITRLKKLNKICNHFHLSIQSCCDETLKRMNRRYTFSNLLQYINLIKTAFNNNVILTTDIIVGFPGETEQEFNETYNNLKHINLHKIHVFKYSKRQGTKAYTMQNQVDDCIKELRSKKIIELSNNSQIEYNKNFVNKTVNVLFEETKHGFTKGHMTNYIVVNILENKKLENTIMKVKIKSTKGVELYGEIVDL